MNDDRSEEPNGRDPFPRCDSCGHPEIFHGFDGCTFRFPGTADREPRLCECIELRRPPPRRKPMS